MTRPIEYASGAVQADSSTWKLGNLLTFDGRTLISVARPATIPGWTPRLNYLPRRAIRQTDLERGTCFAVEHPGADPNNSRTMTKRTPSVLLPPNG